MSIIINIASINQRSSNPKYTVINEEEKSIQKLTKMYKGRKMNKDKLMKSNQSNTKY